MTDQEHDRPEGEESAPAAPPPEARRRLPRPAPESDVKAYIPPVDLPANQDDARRTQELSRVQISPDLDPRRRPTVRRVASPAGEAKAIAQEDAIVDETAPLGTNLRAIQEANRQVAEDEPRMRELKQATVRMRPDAQVGSPSAPGEGRAGADGGGHDELRQGPRGTMVLTPRPRGGTKMMIAGVPESAALPPRRGSDDGDEAPPMEGIGLRVVVLGAVVILGLATLALFASRGIVSPSREPAARTVEAAPSTPVSAEPQAAPVPTASAAADPSATTAADDANEEPAATSTAAPRRGRGRAKPPAKRAPGGSSATPRAPMFERTEGH